MPRTCSTCCVDLYEPHINNVGSQAWANMGYVGFVQIQSALMSQNLSTSALGQTLRVSNFSVGLKQDIEKPPVIDGRIDRTVYKLGPKVIEGTMSMPVIVDTFERDSCPNQSALTGENSAAGQMMQMMWCWATARNPEGRMAYDDVDLNVRYANHAAFTYERCMVNSMTLRVAQGDLLNLETNIYGRTRNMRDAAPGKTASSDSLYRLTDFLAPARVLTWNDVSVTGIAGCSGINNTVLFYSNVVRSWDLTIANNLDRFYTLNGSLYPTDINAAVRDVTGSLEFMGLPENLRQHTSGSSATTGLQSHFTEKNELRFAFYVGDETYTSGGSFTERDWTGITPKGTPLFSRKLIAVVYEIETMELSPELYTTKCNYHGMANDDDGYYEAFDPATSNFPAWYIV